MRSALGKNKIGEFLAKAARNAGLPGNLTNHSVRKTCISRLMYAGVPENYVAQLSGHKNLKSLDSYKTASDDHQRKLSLTLSRTNLGDAIVKQLSEGRHQERKAIRGSWRRCPFFWPFFGLHSSERMHI